MDRRNFIRKLGGKGELIFSVFQKKQKELEERIKVFEDLLEGLQEDEELIEYKVMFSKEGDGAIAATYKGDSIDGEYEYLGEDDLGGELVFSATPEESNQLEKWVVNGVDDEEETDTLTFAELTEADFEWVEDPGLFVLDVVAHFEAESP